MRISSKVHSASNASRSSLVLVFSVLSANQESAANAIDTPTTIKKMSEAARFHFSLTAFLLTKFVSK